MSVSGGGAAGRSEGAAAARDYDAGVTNRRGKTRKGAPAAASRAAGKKSVPKRSRKPGAGPPSGPAPGQVRLARELQQRHPEISFTRAKHEVTVGRVRVGGLVVDDPGAWVDPGARIDWAPDAPPARRGRATAIELAYADEDVVVAVKPAGLLTQPTPEREKDTLLSRVGLELARRRGGERGYLAVVHRLDKETSGLVAFATSRKGLEALQAQLENHTMHRVYDALVEGSVFEDAGTFRQDLVGDGTHRKRWVAKPGTRGKPAVTHWRVVRRMPIATRVSVELETGRTHQIRIHFAAAGHPVIGDRVYRPGALPRFPIAFRRLALHAGELAFAHPRDGRTVRVTTPPPEDYRRLLDKLETAKMRP